MPHSLKFADTRIPVFRYALASAALALAVTARYALLPASRLDLPVGLGLAAAALAALLYRSLRSTSHYRTILDDQTDALARFLPDGTLSFANRAFLQYFELKVEQLRGCRWQHLALHEDAADLACLLDVLTPQSPQLTLERRLAPADLQERWCKFTFRGLFSPHGRLTEVQVACHDTSQAKWLEATLARTADELHELYDQAPCAYFSLGPDGRFTRLNATALAWFAASSAELIGRASPIDFVAVSMRQRFRRMLADLRPGSTLPNTDFELTAPDMPPRFVRMSLSCEWAADDTPLAVHSVLFDITAQRQAERALRLALAEQRAIIDSDLLGIARVRDRHIVWANVGLARLLGYEPGELVDSPTHLHFADADHHLEQGIAAYSEIRAGRCYRSELQMRRKDGSHVWVDVRGVAFEHASRETLWLFSDITVRKQAEAALRASQSFLGRTGAVAGVGGWQIDLPSQRVRWSDETCRLYDLEPGTALDLAQMMGFHAVEGRPVMEQAVSEAATFGAPWDLELPMIAASGRRFWARSVGVVEYEGGRVVRLVGAVQDITVRRQMEHDLAGSRALLQVTLESIGDAVITTDGQGRVNWLNRVAEAMTGWGREDARGNPLAEVFQVVDEDARTALPDPVQRCLATGKIVGLAPRSVLGARDRREHGIEDSIAPIRDENGNIIGTVLVFRDVSEQRRLAREVQYRATHDPLTDLHNRADFETRLTDLLHAMHTAPGPHAAMYIDLDEFKLVNDTCGHAIGDQMLRQIAAMFRQSVRPGDIVARLGGDEFGVLLPDCSLDAARGLGERICAQMNDYRFHFEGRRFRVGTSIGLVPVDERWLSAASVIEAADAACYAAKEAGRNRVQLWVDQDRAARRRRGGVQWSTRLVSAMEDGAFELHCQRLLPLSGVRVGLDCEVLLRLREGSGQCVLPGAFLPPAERFHLMGRIDRWVVREVLALLSCAQDPAQLPGRIAINVSGQSIGEAAFRGDVVAMLADAAVDPGRICFEIRESAAIANLVDARAFADAVRAAGARIAIDDFGATASSFGYLRGFKVDTLKIDRQFIQGFRYDPLDAAALRSFMEVAQALGLETVAKGVEDEDVLRALQALSIDQAQGLQIHAPEPLAQLLGLVAAAAG